MALKNVENQNQHAEDDGQSVGGYRRDPGRRRTGGAAQGGRSSRHLFPDRLFPGGGGGPGFRGPGKTATVIDIVDASNLERNLYLAVQFLELGASLCIALNMMDVAEDLGIEIDVQKLSFLMGVPVIPIVARNGRGKKELVAAAAGVS